MGLPAPNKFQHAVIAGAGPVGLVLAVCLHAYGLSFILVERRKDRRNNGRLAVLFPTCLDLLARLGLDAPVRAAARPLTVGRAYRGASRLGEVPLNPRGGGAGGPLVIRQFDLEKILQQHVERLAPDRLYFDSGVESFQCGLPSVHMRLRVGVRTVDLDAAFLVGTDGPRSSVRTGMGLELEKSGPDDHFVWGEFDDVGGFGEEARIYVDDEGFIESIPLPGGVRRWVVQSPGARPSLDLEPFVEGLRRRTGLDLARHRVSLLAGQTVARYTAAAFQKSRVALAGDAAHTMTPIGGRGINCGLLDAMELAGAIHHVAQAHAAPELEMNAYGRRARARALAELQWAERCFAAGRPESGSWVSRIGARVAGRVRGWDPAADFFSGCP